MEILALGIGSIAGIFVIIFGGRGLIDLARGYAERRRARLASADDSPRVEQPGVAGVAHAVGVETLEPAGPTPAVALVEPDPVYRRTFVGRDAELKQLHDAFDEAVAGHGSLAMVVGEPGIGKTSLCEQLAAHVAERGGKTLVGHCYEEGSLSLPYLAFVEAVRSHVLVLEPDDLKAQLAQGADQLARIVPEIRERMQVELSPAGDPEEERYRLLQAASDFLRNAAAVQSLLVVLEDLHDADRGTLDMLTHLARNLSGSKLLVVGTYRDVQVDRTHPLSSALAELRRVTSFERMQLRGLTQDEVHRMLGAIAGHEVPWRWAEVVHRQTEGNPLFVQEVMRYLVEEGLLAREDGELQRVGEEPLAGRIPEGLRDVIGKRMTRLSAQCNQVLAIAAVVGRDFRLDVLQRVAGVAEEELFAALEEARGVGVIEERAAVGTGASYRFAHAFFRQTLYEEMFAPRRIRFHQQVGRALEEVHARRPEEHAAELAEHFAQSTEREDLEKALAYAEMAAQRSMAVYAYGEAVRLLGQALQVLEVLDPDDRARRCDLLLELGRALLPTENVSRVADAVAPEAFALAEALADGGRASRACRIATEGLRRTIGGTGIIASEFRRWAERADHYAAPGTIDRVHADLMLARVARQFGGDNTESLALTRRALELARQLDDPETLFDVVRQYAGNLRAPQHQEERQRLMEEFVGWSREGVNAGTLCQVLGNNIYVLLEMGDRARAEALVRELGELGERTRDNQPLVQSLEFEILFATVDGRLEEAVAAGERLSTRAEELGVARREKPRAGAGTESALLYLGRVAEALTALRERLYEGGATGQEAELGSPWEAPLLAHVGRQDEARDLLRQLRVQHGVGSPEDETTTVSLAILLQTAVLVEDLETAVVLAKRLAGAASSPIVLNGPQGSGVARHLGAAAALLGEPEKARAYYEQAREVCAKIGFRPEIALTRLQLAELLLEHYPAERTSAIEHLDFAIGEFHEMKMQPSLEKAEALKVARTN